MKQLSWWSASIAALGSAIIVATTLLHYIQAHQSGSLGGYFSLVSGALGVGLVTGVIDYFSSAPPFRSILRSAAITLVVGVATAGLLVAIIISVFGS